MCASIHFEWASTGTKKILPIKGPVSMCILDQGRFGHSQGYKWAGIGDFCTNQHVSQSFASLSISASTLGHQMIPPGDSKDSRVSFVKELQHSLSTSLRNNYSIPPHYAAILNAEFIDSFYIRLNLWVIITSLVSLLNFGTNFGQNLVFVHPFFDMFGINWGSV